MYLAIFELPDDSLVLQPKTNIVNGVAEEIGLEVINLPLSKFDIEDADA